MAIWRYYGRDNRAVDRHGKSLPQFGRYGETRARLIAAKAPLASLAGYAVLPSGEVETSLLARRRRPPVGPRAR